MYPLGTLGVDELQRASLFLEACENPPVIASRRLLVRSVHSWIYWHLWATTRQTGIYVTSYLCGAGDNLFNNLLASWQIGRALPKPILNYQNKAIVTSVFQHLMATRAFQIGVRRFPWISPLRIIPDTRAAPRGFAGNSIVWNSAKPGSLSRT